MVYIVNEVKHLGPQQIERKLLAKISFENGQFTVIQDNGLGDDIEHMPLPRAEQYLKHLSNSQYLEVQQIDV